MHLTRRRLLSALLGACTATLAISSPGAAQPAPLDGFDAAVATAVRDWQVPGLAVAVIKDGTVLFSRSAY